MRKYFEHAYKGFCIGVSELLYFASVLGEVALIIAIYITLPLWIIPYSIYRKKKGA